MSPRTKMIWGVAEFQYRIAWHCIKMAIKHLRIALYYTYLIGR